MMTIKTSEEKQAAINKALAEFREALEFAELLNDNGDGVPAAEKTAAFRYMQEKFRALESIRRAA